MPVDHLGGDAGQEVLALSGQLDAGILGLLGQIQLRQSGVLQRSIGQGVHVDIFQEGQIGLSSSCNIFRHNILSFTVSDPII
jgi:hypothetical protein